MAKSFGALIGISPPSILTKYTTSWLIPPFALACLRLLISFYIFLTIFIILGTDSPIAQRHQFSYFTFISFWGLAFYFLFSGLHTLSYARTGTSWLQRWPRILQALHAIYYTTIVTYPIIVTIVYWAIIYEGPWFPLRLNAWENISEHALNTVFCLLEITLPLTLPPPPLHLAFLVLFLALYLGLAYLTYATEHFYTYAFLNPANGKAKTAGYIIGIAVAACIVYGIVWALIWVRGRLTRGRGKFARGDVVNGGAGEKGVGSREAFLGLGREEMEMETGGIEVK